MTKRASKVRGYVVGIDAGGSGTTTLVATPDGQAVAQGRGGPANILVAGEEGAREALASALDAAFAAVRGVLDVREQVVAVAAGVAGAHVSADIERVERLLEDMLPGRAIKVYNDGEIALAGATGGREGIVVVAGTGSIALGRGHDGRTLRCGGWGYIIGDEGSAYTIVRRALQEAAWVVDGRTAGSALVDAFVMAFGVPDFDSIVPALYGPPPMTRDRLAAFAPVVLQCAIAGDESARRVLVEAGEGLADMASTLARRLDLCDAPFRIACSGGVWKAGESLTESFRARVRSVCPQANVGPPLLSPAEGAVLLAARLLDDATVENRRMSLR